jgi:hypothetical protein
MEELFGKEATDAVKTVLNYGCSHKGHSNDMGLMGVRGEDNLTRAILVIDSHREDHITLKHRINITKFPGYEKIDEFNKIYDNRFHFKKVEDFMWNVKDIEGEYYDVYLHILDHNDNIIKEIKLIEPILGIDKDKKMSFLVYTWEEKTGSGLDRR